MFKWVIGESLAYDGPMKKLPISRLVKASGEPLDDSMIFKDLDNSIKVGKQNSISKYIK